MAKKIEILGCPAWGSALAEAFLTLAYIPFVRFEVDFKNPDARLDRLLALNPLGQVPTLVLPDGEILSESLAILDFAANQNPDSRLVPPPGPDRGRFSRWCAFLVAAIYPTFTYGDVPQKWVSEGASAELRKSTDAHRESLWKVVEAQASEPFFLGENFSAIDIYIYVMSHWRPRGEWFEKNCPRLFSIRQNVSRLPQLQEVWKINFGK